MVTSPIGGFMPIPLAMMIPFMAAQSMVMGDAFGRSYQYGKRKISAMTNEEFNALTKLQMMEQIMQEYKQIIPPLKQGIKDSTELQTTIVSEMLQLLPKLVTGLVTEVADNITPLLPKTATPVTTTTARTPASRPSTIPRPDTTTSAKPVQLSYSYKHLSGTSIRIVRMLTRTLPQTSHNKEIQALWKLGKSRLRERQLPEAIGKSLMNRAVAYKSAYEVYYQQFLQPILN